MDSYGLAFGLSHGFCILSSCYRGSSHACHCFWRFSVVAGLLRSKVILVITTEIVLGLSQPRAAISTHTALRF